MCTVLVSILWCFPELMESECLFAHESFSTFASVPATFGVFDRALILRYRVCFWRNKLTCFLLTIPFGHFLKLLAINSGELRLPTSVESLVTSSSLKVCCQLLHIWERFLSRLHVFINFLVFPTKSSKQSCPHQIVMKCLFGHRVEPSLASVSQGAFNRPNPKLGSHPPGRHTCLVRVILHRSPTSPAQCSSCQFVRVHLQLVHFTLIEHTDLQARKQRVEYHVFEKGHTPA